MSRARASSPPETKAEMKRVLDDIQTGKLRPRLDAGEQGRRGRASKAPAASATAHQIEEVGEKLRAMMPWIAKNKLVDKARN